MKLDYITTSRHLYLVIYNVVSIKIGTGSWHNDIIN